MVKNLIQNLSVGRETPNEFYMHTRNNSMAYTLLHPVQKEHV